MIKIIIQNRLIRKNNVYIFLYLMLWFFCGVIYQQIANYTTGKAFIFQEDIKMSSQIQAFKDEMESSVKDDVIRELIVKQEYQKDFMKTITEDGSDMVISGNDEPMGEAWGRYYGNLLLSQGATHFSIKYYSSQREKVLATYGYKVILSLYKADSKKFSYPENESVISSGSNSSDFEFIKDITIYTTKIPDVPIFDMKEFKYFPIRYTFNYIMPSSFVFLDNGPFTLQKVSQGKYNYSLIDFLYFSAVTITTLGYGDILPNSSIVRVVVMIETLLGVIIIGFFISSVFSRKENISNTMKVDAVTSPNNGRNGIEKAD